MSHNEGYLLCPFKPWEFEVRPWDHKMGSKWWDGIKKMSLTAKASLELEGLKYWNMAKEPENWNFEMLSHSREAFYWYA